VARALDSAWDHGYHDSHFGARNMGESGASVGERLQPQSKQLPPEPETLPSLGAIVLRVSWFAILLGLVIQILMLTVVAAFGHLRSLTPVVPNLVQTISWSVLVCVGIATGAAVSKLRLELTGLAGMFSAPIAFKIARSLHKGVSAALGLPAGASGGPSPLVLGLIKAVEYGILAVTVGWIAKHGRGRIAAHALVGLCVGVFFGGIALSYVYASSVKGISTADLLSRGINEVLFPVGCSLVLFASEAAGKYWKSASTQR